MEMAKLRAIGSNAYRENNDAISLLEHFFYLTVNACCLLSDITLDKKGVNAAKYPVTFPRKIVFQE